MNRIKSLVALIAALMLAFLAIPAANAVPPGGKVRQSDFIPALSDTRATGHYQFLGDGIHIWTEGNTSTDKVAEYFSARDISGDAHRPLPTKSKMTWLGLNTPANPQPGVQIVFNVDHPFGNGNDYNILVGEPVYGVDGQGFYTDWWLTNGSSADAKAVCPLTTGGSGTACHGSLTQWSAALPNAIMYAGGFSLGSGVKNDGVLHSIQYNDDVYGFTNIAPVVVPNDPPVATVNVTGKATAKVHPGRAKVVVTTDPTPAGSFEGAALQVRIVVDGKVRSKFNLGAAEKSVFRYHPGDGKKHVVKVFGNDDRLGRFVVKG